MELVDLGLATDIDAAVNQFQQQMESYGKTDAEHDERDIVRRKKRRQLPEFLLSG